MANEWQLLGKYLLRGKLVCVTGLHIGGTAQGIEIGGMDNPVVRDPLTDIPYIPGSSLKGKLRSLLEWSLGLIEKHDKQKSYAAYECKELIEKRQDFKGDPLRWDNAYILARLFGPASDKTEVREQAKPTRLTVRDSFPEKSTLAKWHDWLGEETYTEIKTENAIDRVTSEATPRSMERVPAGSEFDVEMIVDIYQKEDTELFRGLFTAMHLLENSALGGSGTRGHGQMRFQDISLEWRSVEYYQTGAGKIQIQLLGNTVEELVSKFSQIQWEPKV